MKFCFQFQTILNYIFINIFFNLFYFNQITEGLIYHYKFDNNLKEELSNAYLTGDCVYSFVEDHNGVENSAIYFEGLNDYCMLKESDISNI